MMSEKEASCFLYKEARWWYVCFNNDINNNCFPFSLDSTEIHDGVGRYINHLRKNPNITPKFQKWIEDLTCTLFVKKGKEQNCSMTMAK